MLNISIKTSNSMPRNRYTIWCVDQGSIAEALFTIHNVVDFDLSVRCRVAHVHLLANQM